MADNNLTAFFGEDHSELPQQPVPIEAATYVEAPVGMNIITDDHVHIEAPTGPLQWYDQVIPAGRIYEAWLSGAEDSALIEMAREACLYRTEKRHALLGVRALPEEGSEYTLWTVYEDPNQGRPTVHFVFQTIETTVRPMLRPGSLLARFVGFDPNEEELLTLIQAASARGFEVASWRERRGVLVPKGQAGPSYAEHWGADVVHNAHALVRRAVLELRCGGITSVLQARGRAYLSEENDGTVAITRQVKGALQGTWVLPPNEERPHYAYIKGVVREPFEDEASAFCSTAAFDHTVHTYEVGEFHVMSNLPASRASLNQQAVDFTSRNPAAVVDEDNLRLAEKTPYDYLPPDARRKNRAGVPLNLLAEDMGPWNELTHLHVDGIRCVVHGSYRVKHGYVRPSSEAARLLAEMGFMQGDTITLLRDPALPNASGMADFELGPELPYRYNPTSRDVYLVLHPLDVAWKRMGGDFDGDQAVAFRRTFAKREPLPMERNLKVGSPTPLLRVGSKRSLAATVVAMANGLATRLGDTVACASRLAERGMLDDEARVHCADLAQGCVSAQKHHMDVYTGQRMYGELRQLVDLVTPAEGFLTDRLREVRRGRGYDEKKRLWEKLVDDLPAFDRKLPAVSALCDRVLLLDELFTQMDWFRGSRATLPSSIREAAVAALVEGADTETAREIAWVKRFTRAYRQAARKLSATQEREERAPLARSIAELRARLRLALYEGRLSELALVAYGPHALAAQLASPEVFERLALQRRDLTVTLYKDPGASALTASALLEMVIPSQHDEAAPLTLLEPQTQVRVTNLPKSKGSTSKVQPVYLSW